MNRDVEKTLPEGWKYAQLGDLSEYINGYTFKSKDWSNKGLPIIRIQNLNGKDEYNYFESEIKEKYKVFNGDILISWSASLDVYYWQGGDAVLNQHIFNTKLNTEIITKEFFYHTIKYSLAEISRNLHGMGLKHITKGKFERILSPLPPLEEQKRIVNKIDTLFAKIDKAISLTEESLVHAKNLLPSVLKEVFEKGKADGWEEKKLAEVCTIINGRAYKKTELLSEGKYKVLRVGNLFTNNSWYWSDLELKEDKYISNGDLIYAWSASFGPRMWSGEKVIYHYHIWKVVEGNQVSKDFLFNWLDWKTETIKKENTTGTTMMHVTKGMMESLVIHYPDIQVQEQVVKSIEKLKKNCVQTQFKLEEQLGYLKQLKSSILSKAFKGEL